MSCLHDFQKDFEEYLANSKRKLIVFVVNRGPALAYGLGTYTENICEAVKDNGDIDFVGVVLDNGNNEIVFKYLHGLPFYYIPYSERNKHIAAKSTVYFIASRLKENRKLSFHFNLPDQLILAEMAKSLLGAKIIYTQHFMEWGIQLGGDRNELLKRLAQKDSYISRKFSDEKRIMALSDIVIAVAKNFRKCMNELY